MNIRIPYSTFEGAKERALHMAASSGETAYVNRLASSGPMKYEAATVSMDTTFGGGTVYVAAPPAAEGK